MADPTQQDFLLDLPEPAPWAPPSDRDIKGRSVEERRAIVADALRRAPTLRHAVEYCTAKGPGTHEAAGRWSILATVFPEAVTTPVVLSEIRRHSWVSVALAGRADCPAPLREVLLLYALDHLRSLEAESGDPYARMLKNALADGHIGGDSTVARRLVARALGEPGTALRRGAGPKSLRLKRDMAETALALPDLAPDLVDRLASDASLDARAAIVRHPRSTRAHWVAALEYAGSGGFTNDLVRAVLECMRHRGFNEEADIRRLLIESHSHATAHEALGYLERGAGSDEGPGLLALALECDTSKTVRVLEAVLEKKEARDIPGLAQVTAADLLPALSHPSSTVRTRALLLVPRLAAQPTPDQPSPIR